MSNSSVPAPNNKTKLKDPCPHCGAVKSFANLKIEFDTETLSENDFKRMAYIVPEATLIGMTAQCLSCAKEVNLKAELTF